MANSIGEKLLSWTESATTEQDKIYNELVINGTNGTAVNDIRYAICIPWKKLIEVNYIVFLSCTCISILACLIAVIVYCVIRTNIFGYGPEKKDTIRHWINWNFLISFLLRDIYIATFASYIVSTNFTKSPNPHAAIRVFLTFFAITNFYWMFAEGLWLYFGVFYPTKRMKWRWMRVKISLIGWFLPAILVSLWAMTEAIRVVLSEDFHKSNVTGKEQYDFLGWPGLVCIMGPIYILLLLNLVMMIKLLCKMPELFQYRPRRRLAKAIILMALLLGIPYVAPIILIQVFHKTDYCHVFQIIDFINNMLSSLQGFFVATFCVLTNKQVVHFFTRKYRPLTLIMSSLFTGSKSTHDSLRKDDQQPVDQL